MGCPSARIFLLLIALPTLPVWGANILGIFTSHSPSHLILHMSIMKTLVEEGHNVTVVTVIKPPVTHTDIHLIVVPLTKEQEEQLDYQFVAMVTQNSSMISTFLRVVSGTLVIIDAQRDLLLDPRFQRIYETKFDLMFMEYFINDFQLGVAAKLQVPVIMVWTQTHIPVVDDYVGNPAEISYVPAMGTVLGPGQKMGFTKRLENLVKDLAVRGMFSVVNKLTESYYKQVFGNEPNFPTISEMKRNISMVFGNSYLISEGPIRPLVPASIEIGGIHMKDKADPLTEDIAKFLENAKDGAILLSLGSNIKSSTVKPELINSMFKVLSELKQQVIWKWEDLDNTPGESQNILYKKWLPQDDILAHPKIKLFITHAGKGGITEAQYHGVPMLALPLFGDQPTNAEIMQKAGYGLAQDLFQLTEDNFRNTIQEVLGNKKYALAIGRFSKLYRDRPLTAKQTVVYWTEYVLRHKGASHLQSPAIHMSTLEYYNIDVYAVLTAVLFTVLLLIWLIVKFTCLKSKKNKKVKRQ